MNLDAARQLVTDDLLVIYDALYDRYWTGAFIRVEGWEVWYNALNGEVGWTNVALVERLYPVRLILPRLMEVYSEV